MDIDKRPLYHMTPQIGWMNDPNGFSYYDGKYHLFYQYHPYSTEWGPMHWGHVVSEDMLSWEYLPIALIPEDKYDHKGCFSGSALTTKDGKHLLVYTGVSTEEERDIQRQCVAIGDGLKYKKYEGNPVIDFIPNGASKYDFRDPKAWLGEDGIYRCVVANMSADGSGQILLYESDDGFKWFYNNVLLANHHKYGKMWECPDFFKLQDKWVLITSPQDVKATTTEYANGSITLGLIGQWDGMSGEFLPEHNQCIDQGIDFYAPQTYLMPDGRRILIGWMQNWETCKSYGPDSDWYGQMTIPRELTIQNNRLYQKPVREIEQLRSKEISYKNIDVEGVVVLDGVKGRTIDMIVDIEPYETGCYDLFEIQLAAGKGFHSTVKYDVNSGMLIFDRKYAGIGRAIINTSECQVSKDGRIQLRILMDRYSVEIFVNDGERAMTNTIYTDLECDEISFFCEKGARMNLTKYDLIKK